MTLHCALCGRLTLQPAVMIGSLPVGPKCAKRAGLLKPAARRVGQLRLFAGSKPGRVRDEQMTLELFGETE
jgi:hypothetical protein